MTKLSDLKFLSFQEGIDRVKSAMTQASGQDHSSDGSPVLTSKDATSIRAIESLKIHGLPEGFDKWQLPVYLLGEGAQFFMTVVAPGAKADEHAHENGAALRVVVSGSITYAGQELTQGDWMFIPRGTKYAFTTGRTGATLFYCYPCCCATKEE